MELWFISSEMKYMFDSNVDIICFIIYHIGSTQDCIENNRNYFEWNNRILEIKFHKCWISGHILLIQIQAICNNQISLWKKYIICWYNYPQNLTLHYIALITLHVVLNEKVTISVYFLHFESCVNLIEPWIINVAFKKYVLGHNRRFIIWITFHIVVIMMCLRRK